MTPAEMSAHLRVVCPKAPVIPVLVIEDAASAADLARALVAGGVECCVDLFHRSDGTVGGLPSGAEGAIMHAAAFGTGAMTRGTCHGFIEEEEAGVAIGGRHADPWTARLFAKRAGDPRLRLPAPGDRAFRRVQAAPVAHEAAATGCCGELAEGIDPVRQHEVTPSSLWWRSVLSRGGRG